MPLMDDTGLVTQNTSFLSGYVQAALESKDDFLNPDSPQACDGAGGRRVGHAATLSEQA